MQFSAVPPWQWILSENAMQLKRPHVPPTPSPSTSVMCRCHHTPPCSTVITLKIQQVIWFLFCNIYVWWCRRKTRRLWLSVRLPVVSSLSNAGIRERKNIIGAETRARPKSEVGKSSEQLFVRWIANVYIHKYKQTDEDWTVQHGHWHGGGCTRLESPPCISMWQ